MDLKTPGAFALIDSMTETQITTFVRKVEKLGYGSFWFPEAFGQENALNNPRPVRKALAGQVPIRDQSGDN